VEFFRDVHATVPDTDFRNTLTLPRRREYKRWHCA